MAARRAERRYVRASVAPPRTRSVAVYDDDTVGEMEVELSSRLGKVFIRLYTDAEITMMVGFYDSASPVVRFRGNLENVNRALRSVSFEAQQDETGEDDVLIEVTDSDGAITTESVNLWIRAVNDAPVISSVSVVENVVRGQVLSIFGTTISDVDLDDAEIRDVRVELSVNKGRIGLNSLRGLNLLQGNGEDLARVMIVEGNLENINEALYRIRYLYEGDDGTVSEDELTVRVNDLGSHGEGGEMTSESVTRILF